MDHAEVVGSGIWGQCSAAMGGVVEGEAAMQRMLGGDAGCNWWCCWGGHALASREKQQSTKGEREGGGLVAGGKRGRHSQ
jgi:hypothetical protein